MARAELTRAAEADVLESWSYIAKDNPNAADKFVDGLSDHFHLLANTSGIGRARPELINGLRSSTHKSYTIFYFPKDYGVLIYRVLHAARDIDAIFSEDFE